MSALYGTITLKIMSIRRLQMPNSRYLLTFTLELQTSEDISSCFAREEKDESLDFLRMHLCLPDIIPPLETYLLYSVHK